MKIMSIMQSVNNMVLLQLELLPLAKQVGTLLGAIGFIVSAALFIIYYLAKKLDKKEAEKELLAERVFTFLTKTEPLMGKIDKLMDMHAETKQNHEKVVNELASVKNNLSELRHDLDKKK